jgi:ketosteroid isomerase-like protein
MQALMKRSTIFYMVLLAAATIVVPRTSAGVDEKAVKTMITDWYAAYAAGNDEAHYRTFLADDYVLLENGELVDLEGDVAAALVFSARITSTSSR